MNLKFVLFVLGKIALAFAGSLIFPLLVSLYYGEEIILPYLVPILISLLLRLAVGKFILKYRGRLSLRDGLGIVGLSWCFVCFMGALPYFLLGIDVISAFFESVAGFTTTGASSIKSLAALPASLLLWRSLTQWLGGLAIILVFITLVPQVGSSGERLFTAELHGESSERMMPRIRTTISLLGLSYTAVTLLLIFCLWLFDMSFFSAANYAMATVSTGGFTPVDGGLKQLNSPALEIVLMIFMLFSGGSYILYYKVYKDGLKSFWHDKEFLAYLGVILFFGILLAINLAANSRYEGWESFYQGLFQAISVITTTGFSISDYNTWPEFSRFCILLMMFVGGCAGSTAGGIKVARLMVLFKLSWSELKRTLHPHMVVDVQMSGNHVPSNVIISISRFFFVYMAVFVLGSLLLSLTGSLGMLDAIGIAASCLANIGPAFDMVAPFSTYADVSGTGKLLSCVLMIFGRLEIFTLLIFFSPEFWHSRKNW